MVAGRRKKEKKLIAPILFKVTLNAVGFEQWLAQHLLTSLKNPSVLIVDNSSIYRKNVIRELVEVGGHQLLFLPKYSPDLNEIEHDFSASKRARMYSPINTSFDEIIRGYCDNSVSFLFKRTISSIFHLGKRFKFCICK